MTVNHNTVRASVPSFKKFEDTRHRTSFRHRAVSIRYRPVRTFREQQRFFELDVVVSRSVHSTLLVRTRLVELQILLYRRTSKDERFFEYLSLILQESRNTSTTRSTAVSTFLKCRTDNIYRCTSCIVSQITRSNSKVTYRENFDITVSSIIRNTGSDSRYTSKCIPSVETNNISNSQKTNRGSFDIKLISGGIRFSRNHSTIISITSGGSIGGNRIRAASSYARRTVYLLHPLVFSVRNGVNIRPSNKSRKRSTTIGKRVYNCATK